MKNFRAILIGMLLGTTVMMVSCVPSNKRFLSNFERFVAEVTVSCEEMTSEDWSEANKKYNVFMEEYERSYSSSFSWEENQRFGQLRSDYSKAVFKGMMDDSGRVVMDGMEIVEGIADDRDIRLNI